MPRLSEIQAAFQRYVLTQDPAIAAHIASSERFGRDQRLAVYANAYRARLVEALASDYQAVRRSLGEEAFTRLCHAYIRAHSSTSYSLRWFGEHLPAFLRQDYPEHLSELARFMEVYPQILLNLRVKARQDLKKVPQAQQAIQAAENQLKGRGRLLVRFSGTEPLLRVMAEGENQAEITEVAQDLVQTLDRCLN